MKKFTKFEQVQLVFCALMICGLMYQEVQIREKNTKIEKEMRASINQMLVSAQAAANCAGYLQKVAQQNGSDAGLGINPCKEFN